MNRKFPIDDALPELLETVSSSRNVVLSAPPGAGKTTRVPLALISAKCAEGKRIIILEPRRLAARRAAEFMSSLLGQETGESVGYRTRGDTRISSSTQIEVVTEGVLTRMLHDAPDLPGVGLVIFDEFHERSLQADLGLALALDVQLHLRDDLRILVMSATLDVAAVSRLLGNAPVVESPGKSYPVKTHYLSAPLTGPLEAKVVEIIRRSVNHDKGDILVFLPGQREIRRTERLLGDVLHTDDVQVCLLYGEARDEIQRAALAPAKGGLRKVILSTSIAETSLTIDGVRIVVDAGLARSARFDPRRGMSGLVTTQVSQAAADQRRGRAGRQATGVCYRLWTEQQHAQLPAFPSPEIRTADLAQFVLDLARWGVADETQLRFLDTPPAAHILQARTLLKELDALDVIGKITSHGQALSDFSVHPRLAHMLVKGKKLGLGSLACDISALLQERLRLQGERDLLVDLRHRWQAMHSRDTRTDRVLAESTRLRKELGVRDNPKNDEKDIGILLALAYPERVAKRRAESSNRYQMSRGTGAVLPESNPLCREEFLAIADVDGVREEARVFLAAPLQKSDILKMFGQRIIQAREVFWDSKAEAVTARSVEKLGELILSEKKAEAQGEAMCAAMIEGIKEMGLSCLPWDREAESFRQRSEWVRKSNLVGVDWPELSDGFLAQHLDEWLRPFLDGTTRRSQLPRLEMNAVLKALFSYAQLQELHRLAPLALEVPTGTHIRVDYSGEVPILAVKLQEMFGQIETPTVGGGRINVLIHLLSPAGRPLAVTQDLKSFWQNAYPEVRKQMRGRYSKHPWPVDPLHAPPTRRTKRK